MAIFVQRLALLFVFVRWVDNGRLELALGVARSKLCYILVVAQSETYITTHPHVRRFGALASYFLCAE